MTQSRSLLPALTLSALVAACGPGGVQIDESTTTPDIARQINWPRGFTARIRQNGFTRRWHGREDELKKNIATEGPKYRQAFTNGDPEDTGVWFGEAAGMITDIQPAGEIITDMVADAAERMGK